MKVFEGVDEEPPNKPTFGRVLDGPVAPTKYYQGVPPPSYYINTAISPVHSKPPLPPSVPPKPPKPSVDLTNDFDSLKRNSFLNSIATRAEDDAPSPAPSGSWIFEGGMGSDVSSNPYYQNYYGREDEPMSVSLMTASITTEVRRRGTWSAVCSHVMIVSTSAGAGNSSRGSVKYRRAAS